MNRGGFSWRRFFGVSKAKNRISRAIGVPLSRSGRQRKFGRMMGCGCLLPLLSILLVLVLLGLVLFSF
jgi:hypothetical protein